jgi:cytidylate kinase
VRVIAIDGPAGAGKSSVAKQVSATTGLPYLDTGAMYRCVAYAIQVKSIDINDASAVGEVARTANIEINEDTALLDNVDVSSLIRSSEINSIVSVIAAHSPVRDAMRQQQRDWISTHGGGVVEGRDIGTVVFPDAVLKIFLTATPMVRAERRVSQNGGDLEQVAAAIAERDHIDSSREDSPLKPSHDSYEVDSSNKNITDVVAEIVTLFRQKEESIDHG